MMTLRALSAAAGCLALVLSSPRLDGQDRTGASISASGSASTSFRLSYPETPSGIGAAVAGTSLESELRAIASGPTAMLRMTIGALATGDRASGIDPSSSAADLRLELREAEATFFPAPELALRAGLLLRDFGLGGYGSPIEPMARGPGQGGFWGLEAEWTISSDIASSAFLSADRIARTGALDGFAGLDAGAMLRYSPGSFDAAAGLFASGNGRGEARPIAYLSFPLASILASLEAAVSVPASGPDTGPSGSLRFELRKGLDLGWSSLEIGAAYRGLFPGRDEAGIEKLFAATPPEDAATLPFAPFYGRNYAELSLSLDRADSFSLSAEGIIALPWGSASASAKAELYLGDASIYLAARGVAGEPGAEFNGLAAATAQPGLELSAGAEFSF